MADEDDIHRMRNELVEAFFAGNTDRVAEVGQAMLDLSLEPGADGMPFGDEVGYGPLVVPDEMPDDFEELWILDGLVTAERLAELEDGADLTPDELALAQDRWVRNVFAEIPEPGFPLWQVCITTDLNGRSVFSATVGKGRWAMSGSEWAIDFVGAFGSLNDALAALRRRGYIGLTDYEARHPRVPHLP